MGNHELRNPHQASHDHVGSTLVGQHHDTSAAPGKTTLTGSHAPTTGLAAQLTRSTMEAASSLAELEAANQRRDSSAALAALAVVERFATHAPVWLAQLPRGKHAELVTQVHAVIARAHDAIAAAPKLSQRASDAARQGDFTQWRAELAHWRETGRSGPVRDPEPDHQSGGHRPVPVLQLGPVVSPPEQETKHGAATNGTATNDAATKGAATLRSDDASTNRARHQPHEFDGQGHLNHDPVSLGEAEATVQAAADIVQHNRGNLIASAPSRFRAALNTLLAAVTGRSGGRSLSGVDQVQSLDAAMVTLEPAISIFRGSEEGAIWLDEQLMRHVTLQRSSARFARAADRVDNSIFVEDKAVELPNDSEPRKQGELLHQQIRKFAPIMGQLNEQVIRLHHHAIEHEAEELLKGTQHENHLGPGSLVQLQSMLWLVDGFLTLSDEEFRHELAHVQGVRNGIATYSELVKVATELLGGSVVMSAAYAGSIAKLAGDASSTAICAGVVRSTGLYFAKVIAIAEVVHGAVVLADPHASADKKVEAGFGAASGAAWLVVSRTAGATAATAGFAASSAILLGYGELKLMAHAYSETTIGITSGLMRMAFETLQHHGAIMAKTAERVAKSADLMHSETDHEQAADLKRVHDVSLRQLAYQVDQFLDDCAPRGYEPGIARYPGAYEIFRELFGPLRKYKTAADEATLVQAATETLAKITWALNHASDLVMTTARHHHLNDLEQDLTKHHDHGEE